MDPGAPFSASARASAYSAFGPPTPSRGAVTVNSPSGRISGGRASSRQCGHLGGGPRGLALDRVARVSRIRPAPGQARRARESRRQCAAVRSTFLDPARRDHGAHRTHRPPRKKALWRAGGMTPHVSSAASGAAPPRRDPWPTGRARGEYRPDRHLGTRKIRREHLAPAGGGGEARPPLKPAKDLPCGAVDWYGIRRTDARSPACVPNPPVFSFGGRRNSRPPGAKKGTAEPPPQIKRGTDNPLPQRRQQVEHPARGQNPRMSGTGSAGPDVSDPLERGRKSCRKRRLMTRPSQAIRLVIRLRTNRALDLGPATDTTTRPARH